MGVGRGNHARRHTLAQLGETSREETAWPGGFCRDARARVEGKPCVGPDGPVETIWALFCFGPTLLGCLGSCSWGLQWTELGLVLGGFGPTKGLELGLGLRPQKNKNK